eukprot:CAMPEP_0196660600 /NCGR_PEP_ID=MMETSP1086-20130531/40552_1 /TAXON_ID=77921 /ORGANISM="Cyanoptyche  gloeocystis , Strain SAG4.97" /LENGTH=203 /DNA_ID=CAMNT_0041995097 /DNA_START=96 /DNA_END=707 /DNA_ORIENTATION=+
MSEGTCPEEGHDAPDFSSTDQDGNQHTLKSLLKDAKHLVLYFYPKDDTPGCTKEACGFRDDHEKLKQKGITVVGISVQDEKSHTKFAKKYKLPFTLLADTDHSVCEAYGVWRMKSFMGRKSMGTVRATFVIAQDGKIVKRYDKVSVDKHSADILSLLSSHETLAEETIAHKESASAADSGPKKRKAEPKQPKAKTLKKKKKTK